MHTWVDEIIIGWQREAIYNPQYGRTPHDVMTQLQGTSDIEGDMLWIEMKLRVQGCWLKTYHEMQSSQIKILKNK